MFVNYLYFDDPLLCYVYADKEVGVLPIRIVKSNVSSVGPSSERNMCLSDKGPTLDTWAF